VGVLLNWQELRNGDGQSTISFTSLTLGKQPTNILNELMPCIFKSTSTKCCWASLDKGMKFGLLCALGNFFPNIV
jgi:hypothetical protein